MIIKLKDSSVLSLPNLLLGFVVSASWTVFGIVENVDWNIIIPNGIGIVLSIVSLAIWFIFRQPKVQVISLEEGYAQHMKSISETKFEEDI